MKKLFSVLTIVLYCTMTVFGQSPESFKYQTIVRNSSGLVLANQEVNLTLEILQGSSSGIVVCNETYSATTNEFGLVNLEIGSQDQLAFENIDWANGPYFLRVSLNGTIMGTSELLSVPYALYAKNSGDPGLWIKQGENIYYSQGSVGIGSGLINNSAQLEVTSTTKGFLPPRMTYDEIQAIPEPADGLIVFCINCEINGLGALTMFMYGNWYKLGTTCLPPLPPGEGIHDSTQTQIAWKWTPVSGATGYKWNTSNDYYSAIDLGTDTLEIETGLNCNTEYKRYIWAYSNICVSQPTELTQFTALCDEPGPCPGMPTVEYEGQIYNTVLIGAQCWLKENLNIGQQLDGLANPLNNGEIEKYCYDDDPVNCELYGGLYQFDEMMNYLSIESSRGICPEGWHIPSDEEWCSVSMFLDPTVICYDTYFTGTDAGIKMKSDEGWIENGNGTNSSGFTAIPGGVRYTNYYDGIGWASDIWTSTSINSTGAYYRVFGSNQTGIGRYLSSFSSHHGFAVRCIKDE